MKGGLNTIQAFWADFEQHVVPKDAGDIQRSEMRLAFYGGASALIDLLMKIGEDDISEDAGVNILDSLRQEAVAFAVNLKRKM